MRQEVKWLAAGCLALAVLAGCSTHDAGMAKPMDGEMAPAPPPPPPPPPPASIADDGPGVGSVVVTGSRSEAASADHAATSPIEPKPHAPAAQAGMLTAGDYDDVLNPDLYKVYLDKTLQGELSGKDLPFVDANQRIAIRVVDRLGKPVPLAKIRVASDDGKTEIALRTGADGMAYIYPLFDTLKPGMTVNVSAPGGKTASKALTGELIETGGELAIDLSGDRAAVSKLDLLLTIDATGSMSDELAYLQKELESILDRVSSANAGIDIRVGLIVYRDKGDEYVLRDFPFTSDFAALKSDLMAQRADGGGDMPEAMQDAMAKGLTFGWRDDAVKVNLLVADAPPHDGDIAATWTSAAKSRAQGIHIVPLAASGVDKTAEFLMRAMGQVTGGRYLFLTDDSGIGNPHAEPTVDCYVVTRLDSLVSRVLTSLVRGDRVEPEGDEVIRTVGNYRTGICKVEPVTEDLKGGQMAE
ncbi:VWA domain-containing protein [Hyphomonas sp.]|uniref:VWA domain-containing protein n=1 Tax=Hyphomonas sp. TaxID=87 RepID=UPI0025B7CEB3|nr:VWA domain-containing protein [Hyphomonas sp.]MBI1401094.1 VWA domain-containing protein [Hyphomonas sp.]